MKSFLIVMVLWTGSLSFAGEEKCAPNDTKCASKKAATTAVPSKAATADTAKAPAPSFETGIKRKCPIGFQSCGPKGLSCCSNNDLNRRRSNCAADEMVCGSGCCKIERPASEKPPREVQSVEPIGEEE